MTYWFYNKEILGRVGVEPPKTWAEAVTASAKLKAARLVPVSTNFDYVVPNWFAGIYFDQYHADWAQVVRAQEGDWNWNPEVDGEFQFDAADPRLHASYTYSAQRFYASLRDHRLRYDTPEVADQMANLVKLFPRYSNEDFFVRSDQYTPFLQGRAAMMVNGSWALTLLHKDLQALTPERLKELGIEASSVKPFEWDVIEFPAMEGPLVQSPVRPPEGTTGYYITVVGKNAQQTALAMDFLMFWISKPGYSAFIKGQADAGSLTPQGPPLVTGVQYPPEIQQLFEKVRQGGIVGAPYGLFITFGAGGKSATDLKNLFRDGLTGKLAPKDYAAAVQKYVDDNFAALLKEAGLSEADIQNPARRPSGG